MKNSDVYAYALDFTNVLIDTLGKDITKVNSVILYGSAARGEMDKSSDVDIFVNTESNLDAVVKLAKQTFEAKTTWDTRNIKFPISCIVGDLNSEDWAELKREIISSGITLFGKYKELPKALNHYMLFTIQLDPLKPKDRVRFVRQLYGYESKKNNKVYKQKGMLKELKGFKVGLGNAAAPIETYKELYDFIKKSGVRFQIKEVWM